MRINIKIYTLTIIFLFVIGNLSADNRFFSFSDIKIGLTGYGKTVFEGTKVESFSVEVVGKFDQSRLEDQFFFPGRGILVRVYGKKVKEHGGVVAGMSGSPVYFRGKLAGGISASWKGSDANKGFLALVNPIEDILKLDRYYSQQKSIYFKFSPPANKIINFPFKWEGKKYKGIMIGEKTDSENSSYLHFSWSHSPVITNFSPKTLNLPGKIYHLSDSNVISFLGKKGIDSELKEGSAFAVQFVRGDYTVAVLGTVTCVEGNKIYGLGHSILKKGSVEYFLSSAYIYAVVKGEDNSFRLGSPLKLIGSVVEDRNQGVLGIRDYFPHIVPVAISVKDKDLGIKRDFVVQIVRNKELFINFLQSTLRQSLEDTINRIGEGTVKAEVLIRYLPVGEKAGAIKTLSLKWYYYNSSDYSEKLLSELPAILSKFLSNRYKAIDLIDLKIDLEVEKKKKVAYLESLELREKKGKLELCIGYRPYQDKKKSLYYPLKLGRGKYHIVVSGLNGENNNTNSNTNDSNKVKDFSSFVKSLKKEVVFPELEIMVFKDKGKSGTEKVLAVKIPAKEYLWEGLVEDDFSLEKNVDER